MNECVYTECCCCCFVFCIAVAAAAAAALLAAAFRHRTPAARGFLQTVGTYLCCCQYLFITNENVVPGTPLGSTVAFVRPRLLPIIPCTFPGTWYLVPLTVITGKRGAVGGLQPAAAKPPLYVRIIDIDTIIWMRSIQSSLSY